MGFCCFSFGFCSILLHSPPPLTLVRYPAGVQLCVIWHLKRTQKLYTGCFWLFFHWFLYYYASNPLPWLSLLRFLLVYAYTLLIFFIYSPTAPYITPKIERRRRGRRGRREEEGEDEKEKEETPPSLSHPPPPPLFLFLFLFPFFSPVAS